MNNQKEREEQEKEKVVYVLHKNKYRLLQGWDTNPPNSQNLCVTQ